MNNLQKLRQLSFLLMVLYLWQVFTKPHGINWDTLNVLALAKLPLPELLNVVMIRDFHPPGVHLLLHFWVLLFGDSNTSVIAFSALFALLAAVGSGLLVKTLSDSKDMGWLTGVLVLFSPFLFDPETFMQYVVHLAATAFSWFFLLQLREHPTPKNWIGYVFCTLVSIHAFVTAAMIVPFQLLYVFCMEGYRPIRIRLLAICAVLLASLLPYAITWLQPWHVAHHPDIVGNHPKASLYDLLLLPASLLLTRYDLIFLKPALKPDSVMVLGLLAMGLLIYGLVLLRKFKPEAFKATLFIGIFPPLAIWLFGLLGNIPLFQNRTFLFCLPVVILAPVMVINNLWTQGKKTIAIMLVTGLVVLMQVTRVAYQPPPFERLASPVKAHYRPGDGIVLYPGMSHLGFMRYFRPEAFGLTMRERHFDPRLENVYHMPQRIDHEFFFVTGEDVLVQPAIQSALEHFILAHKRVLVVGFTPALIPSINCKPNVFILNRQDQFEPAPCVKL